MATNPQLLLAEPTLVTEGADTHYGFPRMVGAANGDLLLFYRIGTTHAYDDAVIGMRASSDEGSTWSEERVLWAVAPGCSAHNPVALVTPSGRILLWTSRYEYGPPLRHPGWWSHSDDDGRTWSAFAVFDTSPEHNSYYVTEAIATSDGLLAGDATFPASGAGPCHARIWHSSDGGDTWAVRSYLTDPGANHGNEIGLMEIEPGVLLCILRDRARADVFRFWSRDGGHTWTPAESIRDMLDCVLQRPFLTRLAPDALLLSGRDFGRRRVVAYLSMDSGQTFGQRLELDEYQEDGAYTTAVPRRPDECLISWYSDSHTTPLKPDIKLASLRLVR